jgi:hypothetical protein
MSGTEKYVNSGWFLPNGLEKNTLVLVIHLLSDLKNLEHMAICVFYIHG